MLRKFLALFLLAALIAPRAHAQTVDEILAKHFKAMGGLDNLKKMQTVKLMGKMSLREGMEAPITLEKKRPAMQRMEFTFSGMTGVRAFDGTHAWALMPFMGQKTPEQASDDESRQEEADADFDGPLVDYKAKGHTVELAGKETVDGADAYKLKVTRKDGKVEYQYIDAETYLLVKREGKDTVRGTEMETESTFGNFKEVAGLMLPFSFTMGAKGSDQKQTLTIDSIAVNVPMADSRFIMPAAADSSKAASKPAASAGDAKADAAVNGDAKPAESAKKKK
jgi:outer membrane lipoprotein-sorting protein